MLKNKKERQEWIENRRNYKTLHDDGFFRVLESYPLEDGSKIVILETMKKRFRYNHETSRPYYVEAYDVEGYYLKEKGETSLLDANVSSIVDRMTKMKSNKKPIDMAELFK